MTLDEKSPSGKYCCKILIFLAKLANTVSSKVILKLQDSGTKSYQRHMTSVRQLVYQTFLRLIPRVVGQIWGGVHMNFLWSEFVFLIIPTPCERTIASMCVPSLVCQFLSLCFLWSPRFILGCIELFFALGFLLYCIFTVFAFFGFSVLLKLTFCYFSLLAWRVVMWDIFVKRYTNMIYQYTACLFSILSFLVLMSQCT